MVNYISPPGTPPPPRNTQVVCPGAPPRPPRPGGIQEDENGVGRGRGENENGVVRTLFRGLANILFRPGNENEADIEGPMSELNIG